MEFLNSLFHLCVRRRHLVLSVTGILFVLSLLTLPNLYQKVAILDLLDPKMSSTKDLAQMHENFGYNEILIGTIRAPQWSSQELCQLELKINEALFNNEQIEDFSTPLVARKAQYENHILSYPRLIPNTCQQAIENPLQQLKNTPWENIFTNSSATDYTVYIQFKPLENLGPFGRFDPQRIKKTMDEFQKIDSRFQWSGTLAHEYFNFEGAEQNKVINLIATVALFVGIRAFYGSWLAGLVFFLTLIVSYVFLLAGISLSGHGIGPLEGCLFLIIMISALEDFVFVSSDMVRDHKKKWSEHISAYLLPSFFTSLTTTIGFASLLISDLQMIRNFGMWAALGSMIEWAVVFLLLPAMMMFLSRWFNIANWVNPERVWFSKIIGLSKISFFPRKLIYLSFVVLIILPFSKDFNLTQTPTEMFPPDHPFQQSLIDQQKSKGWISNAYLTFDPKISKEKKDSIIQEIKKDPQVFDVIGYDRMFDYLTHDIADKDIQSLIQSQFDTTKSAENLKRSSQERALVYLKSTETKELSRIRNLASHLCPENQCQLVGEYVGFADFSQSLIKTLFESLLVSLVLVGLVIFYLIRKFKVQQGLALFASILWGPLFVISLIQVCGYTINFVTCMVASILIGLSGDNAVQYLFSGQGLSDEGINARSEASFICAILMAGLSMVFLLSYFQPPRSLGFLLAIGFIGNLVGDLWILKGLLKIDSIARKKK